MNRSEKLIVLKYRFRTIEDKKGNKRCPDLSIAGAPRIPKDDKFKGSSTEWVEMSSDEFSFSENNCEITLDLKPNMVVAIGRILTYSGHKSGRWDFLDIDKLHLKTEQGSLTYTGFELVKNFKKKSDQLYLFEYK